MTVLYKRKIKRNRKRRKVKKTHKTIRPGRRSWGIIVLSRERTELSKTEKKNEHIEHFLKILELLLKEQKWNERKLLKKNVKIRNTFLLSGTRSKGHIKKYSRTLNIDNKTLRIHFYLILVILV